MTGAERQILRAAVSSARRAQILGASGVLCLSCGDEIENKHPNQLYCSTTCRPVTGGRGYGRVCHRDHVVIGDNAYVDAGGYARCKICRRDLDREIKRSHRALRRSFASAQPPATLAESGRASAGGGPSAPKRSRPSSSSGRDRVLSSRKAAV
jgi:hypothetical protein